ALRRREVGAARPDPLPRGLARRLGRHRQRARARADRRHRDAARRPRRAARADPGRPPPPAVPPAPRMRPGPPDALAGGTPVGPLGDPAEVAELALSVMRNGYIT